MYDHYIALDWAQSNMAIARISGAKSDKIKVIDVEADIKELQLYLNNLKGTKILTVEETTTSQWLYTELKEYVDEIIVCVIHTVISFLAKALKQIRLMPKNLSNYLKLDY